MTYSFSYMAHPEKTSARQSRASNDAMSNAKPVLTARGLRSAQLVGQAGGGEEAVGRDWRTRAILAGMKIPIDCFSYTIYYLCDIKLISKTYHFDIKLISD